MNNIERVPLRFFYDFFLQLGVKTCVSSSNESFYQSANNLSVFYLTIFRLPQKNVLGIILPTIWSFDLRNALFIYASLMIYSEKNQNNLSATVWKGKRPMLFMVIQAKWWPVSTFN